MGAADIEILVSGRNDAGRAFDSARAAVRAFMGSVQQAGSQVHSVVVQIDDLQAATLEASHAADQMQGSYGQVGQAAEEAGQQTSQAMDSASGGAEGFDWTIGGAIDALKGMGPVGMAAGAAITAGLAAATMAISKLKDMAREAVQQAMEQQDTGAHMAAAFGASKDQVKRLGKLAGQVYADNFGESTEAVGEAMRALAKQGLIDPKMTNAQIKDITEQAMTLADVFGVDVTESGKAVAQMLRTHIAPNAKAAFDLLAKGEQMGVDKADDLMDTFEEYSTKFRDMGLSGAQALGLMNQGLKAGARDADTVADAIKEFAIRAIDGSDKTKDGFKQLGLSADKMQRVFAKGGKGAAEAFDDVLDRLRKIHDPAKRDAIAVELFGTKAEDLGDSLYALDLDTATKGMDDLAGATERAGDTVYDTASNRISGLGRKIKQVFEEQLGERVLPLIDKAIEKIEGIWEAIQPLVEEGLERLRKAWKDNQKDIEKFADFCNEVLVPVLGVALVGAITAVFIGLENMIKFVGLVGRAWDTFKTNFRKVIIVVLASMDAMITGAAKAFGWVPGLGPKLRAAQKDFHTWATRVISDFDGTAAHARHLIGALGGVADTAATALAKARAINAIGSVAGIAVRGHASGGPAGGWTRVNEQGPELVRLPYGSNVIPAGQSERMIADAKPSTGNTAIINVYALDPKAAANAVGEALAEFVRNNGPLPARMVA